MARADAVRADNPALFDRGCSKVSGSASGGLGKRAQMVRAARGHSPAIFKAIRQGGCHTGAQLRAQLSYLTTKSSFILDSRGTHDGKKLLSPGEIERVARRFENQWNERHAPKLQAMPRWNSNGWHRICGLLPERRGWICATRCNAIRRWTGSRRFTASSGMS